MSDAINVPLLDLHHQYAGLRDEVLPVLESIMESQGFVLGPEVAALEEEIAARCGAARGIGCSSGSDAIILALLALGVGPGDEVICPSYTFYATAGSISVLGGQPVWVDIDPVTYNLDPADLKHTVARCTRLKAIMPVHLYGQAADMPAIEAIAAKAGVPIIEDSAQAIDARDVRGRTVGSIGAVSCLSFYPTKNLGAFGDAGMLTTNDVELADRIAMLRVHGSRERYRHEIIGVNARLDAMQAAVLRIKLRRLEGWTAGRRANAAVYDRAFAAAGARPSGTPWEAGGLPLRTPQPAPEGAFHIYNQYVIRVPGDVRDAMRERLRERGIGSEVYYPIPMHLQVAFADLGGAEGDLPVSEACRRETIALPVYPEMTDVQRDHVVREVVAAVETLAPAKV